MVEIRARKQGELPEFVYPSDYADWPRAWARSEFFSAVGEEAPEVQEDLQHAVFPLFGATWARAPMGLFSDDDQEFVVRSTPEGVLWCYEARDAGDPAACAVAKALGAWMERHNLRADWVADTAIRTLIAWQLEADWLDPHEWVVLWPAWRSALNVEEQRLMIDLGEAWEPTVESRAQARRRLLKRAKKEIDAFLERGAQLAEERGFVPPIERRTPSEHLRWLARFQVVGQSFTEIAKDDGRADPDSRRTAVASGAKQASELIGLPLREADRGAVGGSSG